MRLFQQLKIVFIEVNHAGKTAIIIDNQNFLSQLLGIFYLSDQLSPDVIIRPENNRGICHNDNEAFLCRWLPAAYAPHADRP